MRKIELKEVNIPAEESPRYINAKVETSYAELMISALETPQNKGFTYAEMNEVLPLIHKIKSADNHVLLEEAEYDILRPRVESFTFSFAHKDLRDFVEAVVTAEKHDLNEVEAA